MRLTDLFPSIASAWPVDDVDTSFPPSTDGAELAAQLADAVEVEDVITDVGPDGTVTVTGRLVLVNGIPPAATTLRTRLFPSMGFVFAPGPDWKSDFRVSTTPGGGYTLQVDTLPLQVTVPPDLLGAHPDPAKHGVDSGIALSDAAADTMITRDFSLTIEADGAIRLEPHLPISVGPCRFFGPPATAVHDLSFIASPARGRVVHGWLVRPLDPGAFPFGGGGLGFGGIELDWSAEGTALEDFRKRLRISEDAEIVIEDVVLPSVGLPPVPQHGSFGVRRSLDPGESLAEFLTFKDAPVIVPLGDHAHLFLSRLFFSTPPEGEDWWSGLTLEGGVAWADGDDADFEAELGLIDGDVLRLSFARTPPELGQDVPIIRLDLWKVIADIFRIRAGVSLKELGRDSPAPGAAVQALIDIMIREKPGEDGGGEEPVRVKTEDGKPFEAALTDVGWDRGKPSGNMVMPRGAELHLSRFALELHEMGLVFEHGATYLSLSGGIREKTSPLEGAIWFKRLRGRLAGNPDAPGFQLGGLGAELKVEDVVEITVHGMYRQDVLPDGTRVREQGLGGGIVIHAGGNKWGLTLDVFWGERVPLSGERTDYLLMMVALFGAIPMGPLELRGIEALYANELLPRLEDGDRKAGELKFHSWLKRARPTAVPETRGLDAWKPSKDAWAFGFGAGISFTGAGEVFQLKAFGAGFDSPDASGLVIVVEFGMFESEKPLALGVFEYDFKRDAFVLLIQVDITLDELVDNFPEDLKLRIGGTITIGNKPGLVALGRLNALDTWIGGKLRVDLSELFALEVRAALCVEWLENTHVGGGFMLSVSVKGRMGVIRLEGWGALEVLLRFMLCGSNDFVARLRFEMGFAVVLFGFLRFGIAVALLAEWLAHVPNYFVFRVTFRFETPWFLPNVSYTLECVRGELEPADRRVVTSPLLQASCASLSGTVAARVQRLDGREGGEPTALASVNSLAGTAGAWRGTAEPVPLDATVEINFSVMLADRLGIGSVDPDLGEQVSGDGDLALTTRYALTGITTRRRPLAGGPWEVVEELTDASSPRNFRWLWDVDTRIRGEVAPKKLLLNGSTPFTVGLDNPAADGEIMEEDPTFPCCRLAPPDVARFDFAGELEGPLPMGFTRPFHFQDRGTVAPLRIHGAPCAVRPPGADGATADRVGAFLWTHGPVFTVTASEDLAVAVLRVSVAGGQKARLVVVALDAVGEEVARHHDHTGPSSFIDVAIQPSVSFRTLRVSLENFEVQVEHFTAFNAAGGDPAVLVLDSVECVTAADREQLIRDRERCAREASDGRGEVVTFLARHEYEIALTTELAVRHSSTEWESTTVTERVRFVTAGPPGLNETPEPGLELTPYVVSAPPGGNGLTYREESAHIVLSESLRVFGPGSGSGEAGFRMPVTIVVDSAFDSVPAARAAKSSHESEEWFLANRGEPDPLVSSAFLGIAAALSRDGRVGRYRRLTEVSSGACEPDDVWHVQQPRIGVEPFDPDGRPLWDAAASYMATLRLAGSPVVERAPFEPADLSAFSNVAGSWTVVDGALMAAGSASGRFGEPTWDLLKLEVRGTIGDGGAMGAAVLLDPALPTRGVRAFVERGPGSGGTLRVESTSGVALGSEPLSEVAETSALTIEVFADAIRCASGTARVSVPRDDRGPGRCAVMARDASIHVLRVRGIDMFRLPFRTSRFEGFSEHIASCTGVDRYDADAAAEALASLWARLAGRIGAAMTPAVPAADREAVFNEAASALALPLLEDPERLHVTVASAASDRWFLLESPEPIDFVEEVELELERRVTRSVLSNADRARLGELIQAAIRGAGPGPRPFLSLPDPIGVRARLGPGAFPVGARRPWDRLVDRKVAFTARLVGRHLEVIEAATGTVRRIRTTAFTPADRELLRDVVVDLNLALDIVRWHVPDIVEWIAEPVSIIQNAEATKALVLPHGAPLADGTYRLSFAITRHWFETTEPTGPDNTYLETGVVLVELAG
jgi:hypothetical protein